MFRQIKHELQNNVAAFQDEVSTAQEDRIPPFRPMSDFITDATWNIPNFSDIERFNNRVINNLIYYQTNYFVLGTAIMLLIG
jgi:hypothetical protein